MAGLFFCVLRRGLRAPLAGVAESVRLAVETGVAGLSIEDSTGDPAKLLYDLATALERIRAARKAVGKVGGDVLLVGRAECFLVGRPDREETIARPKAYAQVGADCLYAPVSPSARWTPGRRTAGRRWRRGH
jgi:2-methylisocitrate lyase-like PEP mutase family enzyme